MTAQTAACDSVGTLLESLGAVELPGIDRFVVSEHFKAGAMVNGRQINWLGPNFQKHFGKVIESDVPARRVPSWRLASWSSSLRIIAGLGGHTKAEMKLAHTFQVMQSGAWLTDRRVYITYARSAISGQLWAVNWRVSGKYVSVGARDMSSPLIWFDGHCVLGG